MSSQYKNPPLIEVVFQINYKCEWKDDFHSQFYEKIKVGFPEKKELSDFAISFKVGKDAQVSQNQGEKYFQFFNNDKNRLIILKPTFLSLHVLSDYDGWENFNELISLVSGCLIEILQLSNIERIGLKYLNRINILKQNEIIKETDYFNYSINLPKNLKTQKDTNLLNVSSLIGFNEAGHLLYTLKHTNDFEDDFLSYILDLDFFGKLEIISGETLKEWSTKVHTIIKDVFESTLTKKCENLF